MIPYSLKLVWFCLSLTGIFACWYAFIILPGRNFGGLWGRLWYCVLLTWLEAAFCFGLMYHMDPHQMPHSFCLFQTFSFSMAAFGLSGWCCSFSIATALAVLRPRAFNDASAALSWHPRYIPTLIVYPVLASVVYGVVVVKLDAIKPVSSDDLHCDVTDPIWVRLLGYGGVSPLFSIPFLVLSIISARRLYSLRSDSENRSTDPGLITTRQSFEMLESINRNNRVLSQLPEKPKRMLSRRKTNSSVAFDREFRNTEHGGGRRRNSVGSDTIPNFIPTQPGDFKMLSQPLEIHVQKTVTLTTEEAPRPRTADSTVKRTFSPTYIPPRPRTAESGLISPTYGTYGSPPDRAGLLISPQRQALDSLTRYEAPPPVDSLYSPNPSDIVFSSTPASSTKLLFSPNAPRASQIIDFDNLYIEKDVIEKIASWTDGEDTENDLSEFGPKGRFGAINNDNKTNSSLTGMSDNALKRVSVGTRNTTKSIHPQKLTGAYRRMVLLQIGYFLVQLLAALSTVMDVGMRQLTPFGTQHVALILAGWGPYIVYVGVRFISRWMTI